MKMTLEEFQKESKKRKVAKGEKPAPYTESQKEFAVVYAEEELAQGKIKASVLRTLGISAGALDKWMLCAKGSVKFKKVQVTPMSSDPCGLVLVTPGGNRIEGLNLQNAAMLLKALG